MPVIQRRPPAPREVASRWTPMLARYGWTPIADYFLENYHRLEISHCEAMLIIHLLMHKWDQNAPYPSFKTIAKRMGITDAAVRHHARTLEKKGLLKRIKQLGSTNRFHLEKLFDALEGLLIQDYSDHKQAQTAIPSFTRFDRLASAVNAQPPQTKSTKGKAG